MKQTKQDVAAVDTAKVLLSDAVYGKLHSAHAHLLYTADTNKAE